MFPSLWVALVVPNEAKRGMLMTGYVLAIDQGTTGTKVLIFDREGSVKSLAYSEFTQHYPKPGWVEHDAEEIWTVSHALISEALTKAGVQPSEVRAIGIT